jgi:long-subunit acyl-CoA synthetase (AMP-forming)
MIELSMVSGSGFDKAYALVVLAEEWRPKLSQAAVRNDIQAQLTELLAHVNAHSADYEQLKMLVVASEPWTIENGCLTPTMKIKRSRIEFLVQHQLEGWYSQSQSILWH